MNEAHTRELRRIVLVDDEEALAWSLASRLAKARPYDRVETANDGATALAKMAKNPVDLLVADIRMAGMTGIDLVLAARSAQPNLPVILMTAFKSVDIQRLHSGPFTGFLEKPFEFERLLDLVNKALAPPTVGFSGAISVQTLPDIVQLYVLSSATGALVVQHGSDVGEIWFQQGSILHAMSGRTNGDAAIYDIMTWSGGSFSMRVGATTTERTVRSNWQELLMESARLLDEKLHGAPRASRPGWTQSPPPMGDADLDLDFGSDFDDLEPVPDSSMSDSSHTQTTRPPPRSITEDDMNIKDSLAKLNSIDGFVGAALVDAESGMLLGQEGGGSLNLEVAAAGNTEVVKAKRKTMNNLGLKEGIEDILITLNKQYHLIRPLRSRSTLFFYVALDRSRANLAMARITLADVEKDLTV